MMKGSKTRCSGLWTEARFKSFIVSALRGATRRWKPMHDCIRDARVRRGLYLCEGCGEEVPASLPPKEGNKRRIKNIVADHIAPIVSPEEGFIDWNTWVKRAFVEREGFQALCHACHQLKCNEERARRSK